nr:hypothetical protein [Leucobacter exalbidus]
MERASETCRSTVQALQLAKVPTEALAEYVAPRRRLLIMRAATMRPLGDAWRLGTLLLTTDGALYALSGSTRAAERGRPGYQSESREERRELAAAALNGGYPVGTPVNFDAVRIELDDTLGDDPELPVGISGGELRVRWRAGAPLDGAQTLQAYVRERSELLIHPPLGAN